MGRFLGLIVAAMLAAGCASPALEYARARHPRCQVEPLEERADWVRVRVTCPGQAHEVRAYGR